MSSTKGAFGVVSLPEAQAAGSKVNIMQLNTTSVGCTAPSADAARYIQKGWPKLAVDVIAHPDSERQFPANAREGTDDEILEWCFEKGRRLNEGDLFVWNGFASKLGWRDAITPRLEQRKRDAGISDRDDICTIPDFIDFDEGRFSAEKK